MTKSGFKYSDYSIDIFTSINEADSDNKWSAFKTDFLTGSYLKVLEQSNPSDLQFRYLMISNSHGETCGIIYFQLFKFSGKNIHLKKRLSIDGLFYFLLERYTPNRIMNAPINCTGVNISLSNKPQKKATNGIKEVTEAAKTGEDI